MRVDRKNDALGRRYEKIGLFWIFVSRVKGRSLIVEIIVVSRIG